MARYALTIFLSALLLFQVQPLIGKYILPWFGGSPAVWTTCIVFFQVTLLAGYAYAHLSISRLPGRAQAVLHLTLLALAAALLPIVPAESWKPVDGPAGMTHLTAVLAATVGVPFLLLSATGPLLQAWFSAEHPGRSPYRLYALSNAGSLLGLLGYPLAMELALSRRAQAYTWSAMFLVFAVGCAWCALSVLRTAGRQPRERSPAAPAEASPPPAATDWLLWLTLAACGSMLLLGTTNQMLQDVPPVPLLWVLPLSIYLISFIACFDSDRWYRRAVWIALLPVAIGFAYTAMAARFAIGLTAQLALYLSALLVCCMVCHGELARLKPAPRWLTGFYLCIAAGGALGGLFVTLAAPAMFSGYWEYHVSLGLTAALAIVCLRRRETEPAASAWAWSGMTLGGAAVILSVMMVYEPRLAHFNESVEALSFLLGAAPGSQAAWYAWQAWQYLSLLLLLAGLVWLVRPRWSRLVAPGVLCALGLAGVTFAMMYVARDTLGDPIAVRRNFYGVLSVDESKPGDPVPVRKLYHGRIRHGHEYLSPQWRMKPNTYYGLDSGLGIAFELKRRAAGDRPLNVGCVGLGAGTIVVYGREGDAFCFYEINPDIVAFADEYFTYLRQSAAATEIVLGDGRIVLEHELASGGSRQFDLLILDAFTGDAIPLHLMTREAFDLYWRHLKPDGILAVHVTNRYLNLAPLVRGLAEGAGHAAVRIDVDQSDDYFDANTWVLVARQPRMFSGSDLVLMRRSPWSAKEPPLQFTDDYSNLVKLLHW